MLDTEDAREAEEEVAVRLSADFNVDPITGTCPLEVHFKNKSSGCKEGWWDFGDGEKSVEPNPTHIYNKPGTYTVKLTVSNKVATDEAIKVVQVLPEELSAGFVSIPTRGVAPLEVQFTDSSRGGPEKWYWDFGDGSEGDQRSLTHIYSEPGTYTAKLTVSNKTAKATVERDIFVCQGGADFTVSTFEFVESHSCVYGFVPIEPIRFMDKSTGKPIGWTWDFGDGERSNEQNPVYNYIKGGRYTVTLTVTYANGHISIKKRPDYVVVIPEEFWLNARMSFGCFRDTPSLQVFLSAIFPNGNLDEPMLDKIIRKQVSYRDIITTSSSNLRKDANLVYNIKYRPEQYISLLDSKSLCLGVLGAAQLTYGETKRLNPGVSKSYIYNCFTGSDEGARALESLEEGLTEWGF